MGLFPPHLITLAKNTLESARKSRVRVVTAESCTGGLIAGCLTEIPGSSDVFERGFVTYSNDAKMTNIGVERKTIEEHGAVSGQTALEMAEGALRSSLADIAISVTGIAGPDGGSEEKPVGLVFIGIANHKTGNNYILKNKFDGDRTSIRLKTVVESLSALKKEIERL